MKKNQKTNYNPWQIRSWIQLGFFIVTLAIGLQFFLYVLQASGEGEVTIQRPPGVEGFLPIGALMSWKLFLITGMWDPVHPAAMVLLGFAGIVSLAFRKSFCGWLCPVGTLSEWLWKIGGRVLGRHYVLPVWLDHSLRGVKYLILGFFLYVIGTMSTNAIGAFLESPYYKLSDVKMLHFFTQMSLLTGVVLICLTIGSVFIKNFWCRYFCPYGALMGLFSALGPTRIERNLNTCIDCGRCAKVCPHRLPVDRKHRILSPECSGCMDCTLACPEENTLTLKTLTLKLKGRKFFKIGKRTWTTISLGLVILALFIGTIYVARISGHWQTRVTEREVRMLLKDINAPHMTHPGIRGE